MQGRPELLSSKINQVYISAIMKYRSENISLAEIWSFKIKSNSKSQPYKDQGSIQSDIAKHKSEACISKYPNSEKR